VRRCNINIQVHGYTALSACSAEQQGPTNEQQTGKPICSSGFCRAAHTDLHAQLAVRKKTCMYRSVNSALPAADSCALRRADLHAKRAVQAREAHDVLVPPARDRVRQLLPHRAAQLLLRLRQDLRTVRPLPDAGSLQMAGCMISAQSAVRWAPSLANVCRASSVAALLLDRVTPQSSQQC